MSDFKEMIDTMIDFSEQMSAGSVVQIFGGIRDTGYTAFLAVYDKDTAPYHQVLETLEETLEDDPEKSWTAKDLLREIEKINDEIVFEKKEESEEV